MSGNATYHSINRAKERCNFKNQREAERSIALAIRNGKRAEDFASWERGFLLGEARDDCTAIAYNNFCYIVNSENVCVTLYPLPPWFGKKKRFDGKERIRDYKKYQQSIGAQPTFDEMLYELDQEGLGSVDAVLEQANRKSKNQSMKSDRSDKALDR